MSDHFFFSEEVQFINSDGKWMDAKYCGKSLSEDRVFLRLPSHTIVRESPTIRRKPTFPVTRMMRWVKNIDGDYFAIQNEKIGSHMSCDVLGEPWEAKFEK